ELGHQSARAVEGDDVYVEPLSIPIAAALGEIVRRIRQVRPRNDAKNDLLVGKRRRGGERKTERQGAGHSFYHAALLHGMSARGRTFGSGLDPADGVSAALIHDVFEFESLVRDPASGPQAIRRRLRGRGGGRALRQRLHARKKDLPEANDAGVGGGKVLAGTV